MKGCEPVIASFTIVNIAYLVTLAEPIKRLLFLPEQQSYTYISLELQLYQNTVSRCAGISAPLLALLAGPIHSSAERMPRIHS